MRIDLLAGRTYPAAAMTSARGPTILVFDSGLGGLTVFAEVRRSRPDAAFVYAADDAGFPYGPLEAPALRERVGLVLAGLIARHRPDLVVIACNTASTVVLPHLRARFSLPFVGTVPAIKPAAALSRTGRISVLATPGTVARDYTRGLVQTYAAGREVTLVGSRRLAAMAEAELSGGPVPDEDLREELAPCFVEDEGGRTDVIVLACTHYPLLLPRLRRLAPWPVIWLDPAPAIARRVVQLLGEPDAAAREPAAGMAVFTGGRRLNPILRAELAARGLGEVFPWEKASRHLARDGASGGPLRS